MGIPVVTGGAAQCPFAIGPPFNLLAVGNVLFNNKPVLTIKDVSPGANIVFAGRMCTSMANPAVASATAAAFGVLTPQPCMFAPAGMWAPGTTITKVKGVPVVDYYCSLLCATGAGALTVSSPGCSPQIQVK